MKSLLSAEVTLEVPFHDVDLMGFVWHGHYVKYLEIARTALMRSAGLDWEQMQAWGVVWPVVNCNLKYIRPLRYGQRLRVRCDLQEYLNRIRITYEVSDAASGQRLTRAETIQLAVRSDTGELLFECPQELVDAIAQVRP